MSHTITLHCPHLLDDETECEADVEVELAYEPPDPNYGADADGRRGIYVSGYFYVESIADTCAKGHVLTGEEEADVERRAEKEARDYEPEDTRDYEPDDDYDYECERREHWGR